MAYRRYRRGVRALMNGQAPTTQTWEMPQGLLSGCPVVYATNTMDEAPGFLKIRVTLRPVPLTQPHQKAQLMCWRAGEQLAPVPLYPSKEQMHMICPRSDIPARLPEEHQPNIWHPSSQVCMGFDLLMTSSVWVGMTPELICNPLPIGYIPSCQVGDMMYQKRFVTHAQDVHIALTTQPPEGTVFTHLCGPHLVHPKTPGNPLFGYGGFYQPGAPWDQLCPILAQPRWHKPHGVLGVFRLNNLWVAHLFPPQSGRLAQTDTYCVGLDALDGLETLSEGLLRGRCQVSLKYQERVIAYGSCALRYQDIHHTTADLIFVRKM